MKNSRKTKLQKPKEKQRITAEKSKDQESPENNEFDFGGFPKNIDFKKNLGCGG